MDVWKVSKEESLSVLQVDTTMEATKAEKQPESLFAQAKRHIFGTLKYLSRTNCGISDSENCIVVKADEVTRVESNLIDCLPKEMLSHVASFLPPKDFNSLVRTNKTTRSRLNNRDRQPLHIDMELRYHYDDEENNLTALNANIHLKLKEGRRYFGFAVEEPKMSTGLRKEPVEPLVDWYYNERDRERMDLDGKIVLFRYNIKETLSAHLEFLVSNNVVIDRLDLECVGELEVDALSKLLKENRMRVNSLEVTKEFLGDHLMDLIHVCRPNYVTMSISILPSTFYDDNVIRQINHLVVISELNEMKEGQLAAYYSKKSLILAQMSGITIEDMRLFIQHWIKSPVFYEKLGLFVAAEEPESCCNELVSQLDRRLVEVKAYTERSETYHRFGFLLRCLADGREIFLTREVGGDMPDGFVIKTAFDWLPSFI